MTEHAGESCHDREKRSQSRDSSPELFSDPVECGDGIADSQEKVIGAVQMLKRKVAPDNQNVVEIDQDDKNGRLYLAKHQRCANNDESSPPSVRGDTPICQSTITW